MINSLNSNNKAIGIDIGGTKIKIACVDSEGNILWSQKEAVVKKSSTEFLKQVIRLIRAVDLNSEIKNYRGIGIALPAVIDHDNDTIIQAPNLAFLNDLKLSSLIKGRLKTHSINLPVKLGFDGQASVVAEAWQGSAKTHDNILTITIGTGIGGGIMADGKIVSGYNNVAGALGWTRLGIEEEALSFEEVCAGPGIERMAKKLFDNINTAKEFFDQADKDKESVDELLDLIIKYMGFNMANFVSIFNPEVIVLAGSVGLRFEPYLNDIKEIIIKYAQPISANTIRMTCSELGSNAGVIGAAGFLFI